MSSHEIVLLDEILRSDFVTFLYRCFLWLNPGATFLPTTRHRLSTRAHQTRGNHPSDHQPSASLSEIDNSLGCISCVLAWS